MISIRSKHADYYMKLLCCIISFFIAGSNLVFGRSDDTVSNPSSSSLPGLICEQGLTVKTDSDIFQGVFHLRVLETRSFRQNLKFALNPGLKVTSVTLNEEAATFQSEPDPKHGQVLTIPLSQSLVASDELVIVWKGSIMGKRFQDGKYFSSDALYFLSYSNYYPQLIVDSEVQEIRRFWVQIEVPKEFSQLVGNVRQLENPTTRGRNRQMILEFCRTSDPTFFILKGFSCKILSPYGVPLRIYRRTIWNEDKSLIPMQSTFVLSLFHKLMKKELPKSEITIVMEDPKRFIGGSSHGTFLLVEEPSDNVHYIAHEMGHFFWNVDALQLSDSANLYFSDQLYLTEGMSNFLAFFGHTYVNTWWEYFVTGGPLSFENTFERWYQENGNLPEYVQNLSIMYTQAEQQNQVEALKRNFSFNVKFSTLFFWSLMVKVGPEKFFNGMSAFYSESLSKKQPAHLQEFFDLIDFAEGGQMAGNIQQGVKFILDNWRAPTTNIFSWFSMKGFSDFATPPSNSDSVLNIMKNSTQRR